MFDVKQRGVKNVMIMKTIGVRYELNADVYLNILSDL